MSFLATLLAISWSDLRTWVFRPRWRDQKHRYLSTACLHGEHGDCRIRCKFCETLCLCRCHKRPATFGA